MKNRKRSLLFAAIMAGTVPLAFGPTGIAADCVECETSEDCGPWQYNPYGGCYFFMEGGQMYCNSVGECEREEFAQLDLTPAGTVLRDGVTVDADAGRVLTACGSYVVKSFGDGASTESIVNLTI